MLLSIICQRQLYDIDTYICWRYLSGNILPFPESLPVSLADSAPAMPEEQTSVRMVIASVGVLLLLIGTQYARSFAERSTPATAA